MPSASERTGTLSAHPHPIPRPSCLHRLSISPPIRLFRLSAHCCFPHPLGQSFKEFNSRSVCDRDGPESTVQHGGLAPADDGSAWCRWDDLHNSGADPGSSTGIGNRDRTTNRREQIEIAVL